MGHATSRVLGHADGHRRLPYVTERASRVSLGSQGTIARTMSRTETEKKKRRSGIPTGNAGEYFVMGELLRRGYDAQLADRNTKGYDLLVGRPGDGRDMRRVQVKTVRGGPWYVRVADYKELRDQVTVYVIIGKEDCRSPVRYFIARNGDVAKHVHIPNSPKFTANGFMQLPAVKEFEGRWELLDKPARRRRRRRVTAGR
jgi:hypothetical protein